MSEKEIIKALECCISKNNCTENCPYVDWKQNSFKCIEMSTLDAIELINHQQEEIGRLESCVMSEEQVREIMKSQMHTVFEKVINEAVDEAIKEFSDKLKEKIFKPWYFLDQIKFIYEDIDNLVKEMTGDGDG